MLNTTSQANLSAFGGAYAEQRWVVPVGDLVQQALQEIEGLMNNVEPKTPEGDRYELLSLLVGDYEDKHFPLDDPDPIEIIKFRMDQLNMKSKDLGKIKGYKQRASEILSRKRRLTLSMIRKINANLGIPMELLVKEYEVDR